MLPTAPACVSAGHAVHAVTVLLPSELNTFATPLKRPAGHTAHASGATVTSQNWPATQPMACEHAPAAGVGFGVGANVGMGVGTGVGNGVGTGVGAYVGTGVGTGVGAGVGAGVGEGVGAGVGEGVGAGVGDGVGDGVGAGVGEGVGAGVGRATHVVCPVWPFV